MWLKLRKRQFYCKKFYRQYGVGKYIADFYCPSMKLAIEVDGGQHFSEEGMLYDKEREKFFDALGIKTIRFNNLEVLNNIEGVLIKMEEELTPPDLLFEKEEE